MTNQVTSEIKIPDSTKEAYFTEIFKSMQGEARFAGMPQIFCRFNSGCVYSDGKYGFEYTRKIFCPGCDEPQGSGQYRPNCRIEQTPNKRDFIVIPNPLSFDEVSNQILKLGVKDIHSVSLTGGEPTAFPDAIRAIYNRIGHLVPLYLETNGIRPVEFEEIQDCITYVVPDIKIPSGLGGVPFWDLHEKFLNVCHKYNKHTTIKAVYSNRITDEEINTIIELVKPHFNDPDFDIELCLQPITPYGPIKTKDAPDIHKQLEVQQKFWEAGIPVRNLCQTHKLTGHI